MESSGKSSLKIESRREFLRRAAAVSASLAIARVRLSLGQAAAAAFPGSVNPIRAWITSGEDRFKPFNVSNWQPAAKTPQAAIEIDPSEQFQKILGFGGAFTDASCYLLSRLGADQCRQLLTEFFGPQGLGFSIGRTCIGASDYSRNAYSFDDSAVPDPALNGFSIDHDKSYILPVLREALATNPHLFLLASPWSPPGWMKTGNSLLGGSMRKEYFAVYAQYFVKFLQAYKAEGVSIDAVTVQNEVDTDQNGRMPAALWGQEYEMAFVGDFLGSALRRASLDTKIWLLDHNYNLWGRVMDELSDPRVLENVDGVAWHGYVGDPSAMTKVHDAFPSKNAYWTEGGPDISDPHYADDWADWAGTFAGILKNWARCIIGWNLLLDEKGEPNIGPFTCGGIVTVNSKTGELTRSGQYWAFAHYSRAVHRGARVIATRGTVPDMQHVAFANPGGDYVLVVANQGRERQVNCEFKGKTINLLLPANSVATLQWSQALPL